MNGELHRRRPHLLSFSFAGLGGFYIHTHTRLHNALQPPACPIIRAVCVCVESWHNKHPEPLSGKAGRTKLSDIRWTASRTAGLNLMETAGIEPGGEAHLSNFMKSSIRSVSIPISPLSAESHGDVAVHGLVSSSNHNSALF